MGNKYVDNHLNVDSLSELGEIYSFSPGNTNPRIATVGVPVDEEKTLSLKIGYGGTFPVLDESVPDTSGGMDYLSMMAYRCDDVNDPVATLSSVNRYVHLVDKYMKQRQSFMIDVNSYNSQGMVMMSGAETIKNDLDMETGVKRISYAPSDFSTLSVGLSTFLVAKISREKTIISFDTDGDLAMVLDFDMFMPDFTGSIEYEATDNNKSIEDVLFRKNIIVTGYGSGLKFHKVPEQDFVDEIKTSSFDDIVEVLTSESVTPMQIDGKTLMHGDSFVFNKTRKCIRVILETGEIYSLNPYAVCPSLGSSIELVTVFKEAFVKPSSIQYAGEITTLYQMSDMYITAIDGKFVDRAGKVAVDIDGSSITIIDGGTSGREYFGQYMMSIGIEDMSFHQFGDNDDPIRAVKIGSKYLYFSGVSVFIKDESDVNFTEVSLPTERNTSNIRGANVCDVYFSSHYDTLAGGVTKNSSFMYEMNYMISEDSIDSEIIGDVYPVDFYRIEYMKPSCIAGSLPDFPMHSGHTTAKNRYTAGEVSLVLSSDDGEIGISNAKYSDENLIVYSCLSAFSRWSDVPFVVESFGYVSRDTMLQSQDEHFISAKLNLISEARSSRTYCGNIKKIDADYIVTWVKVRSVNQGESFLFCENEYTDETQQKLGYSRYFESGTECNKKADLISKLSYVTNPFVYTTGMVDMGSSLAIGEISMHDFYVENAIDTYYLGHKASHNIKSTNTVNDFGVNTLSVQNKTVAALTVTSNRPETIDLSTHLWVESFVVTIPEIGFIYNTHQDRYSNMEVISITQIKEQFVRGVKYQFDGFYVTGKLIWNVGQSASVAEYELIDELSSQYNYLYSMFLPDSVDQEFEEPWEPIESYDPYDIVAVYTRKRELDKLRMISMYLVNFLYTEFGFVQNILGVWDESSGVVIDDSSIVLSEIPIESGFGVVATCNGAEPMTFVDHYATISAYKFGIPYRMSSKTRLSISRTNMLSGFSSAVMAEAIPLHEIGEKIEASRVVMDGYIRNFVDSTNNDDVRIEFSPNVFYPQGPWQNPRLYASQEDLIMQGKTYSLEIMPHSRIITSLCVTSGNTVRFSHPAKRFSEVYSVIDGIVTKEELINTKEDSLQRGSTTYALNYIHHMGGGVNLNREIYGDLLLYPSRYSYPINNLIRELISPIREDGHAKAMDARAVFSRFDTRYVSNTIPSYYDKFLEFPTAFTCDAMPEEGVLIRDFSNIESLYKEDIVFIDGNNIVGDDGVAKLSFSNGTDQPITLMISYDNYRWGDGMTSFNIDDAYSLQKEGWLIYEPITNKRVGRSKSGIFLEGTTI